MKVSVVMAVHNGQSFLPVQLDSILSNNTRPNEIIIVDDASSDDSRTVIKDHQRKWPMIKLIQNDRNIGSTNSFFKGVFETSGDVVLFSDQDDQWSQEKISTILHAFQRAPDTLMVYSDGTITDADLNPTRDTIFSTRKRRDLHLGDSRDPISIAANPDIKGYTMAVQGTFVRELLSEQFPDPSLHWGHDHWVALFAFGLGKVKALQIPLIKHRFHGMNSSAGVRFTPWSSTHLRKWIKMAAAQGQDHETLKYRIALRHAARYGTSFSPLLKNELEQLLNISERREQLRQMSLLKRIQAAFAMHREGIYRKYFNGIWTVARDVLLR
jgi:glycosyltransferase involved in cell wall biosynthesis